MVPRGRWWAGVAVAGSLVAVIAAAACAPAPAGGPATAAALTAAPGGPITVLGADDDVGLAVATSTLLFRSAPTVVLAAGGDQPGQARAVRAADRLGAPVLLTPPMPAGAPHRGPARAAVPDPVRAELSRLDPSVVLTEGDAARAWLTAPPAPNTASPNTASPGTRTPEVVALPPDPAAATALLTRYRAGPPDPARTDVLVLARPIPQQVAAAGTARAAGARVWTLPVPDPRSDPALRDPLGAPDPPEVVVLGTGFGPAELVGRRLAETRTGPVLPGGGRHLFPGRRVVALYGSPGTPALGVLGEQDLPASVTRARRLAAAYQPFSAEPVMPAFEIIATVASSAPGPDGDFSTELDPAVLRPWIDAARAAGMYVVLDLQPGRTDFLTQARRYTDLLAESNVGLALDPEWRLAPGQRHRVQVGAVGAGEIDSVVTWLAGLTREHGLPQKLLVLHQFRVATIPDRPRVDTGHPEVRVLVHADGFGTPSLKVGTWNALRAQPLPGAAWGWKDFIDEDRPTLTPQQTLAVSPDIRFVSYQ